jgi:hypothetical protein
LKEFTLLSRHSEMMTENRLKKSVFAINNHESKEEAAEESTKMMKIAHDELMYHLGDSEDTKPLSGATQFVPIYDTGLNPVVLTPILARAEDQSAEPLILIHHYDDVRDLESRKTMELTIHGAATLAKDLYVAIAKMQGMLEDVDLSSFDKLDIKEDSDFTIVEDFDHVSMVKDHKTDIVNVYMCCKEGLRITAEACITILKDGENNE